MMQLFSLTFPIAFQCDLCFPMRPLNDIQAYNMPVRSQGVKSWVAVKHLETILIEIEAT